MTEKNSLKSFDVLHIPNSRFHTGIVSINFYLPLERETVSSYALLASLLTTCSAEYNDYRLLNIKLSSLYGADMASTVSKVGDFLCLKFSVSTIKDSLAFNGEKPMGEAVKLLLRQIFEPNCQDGSFLENDIRREKRMLIEHINGELNNKRLFARAKMIENMFSDEAYGVYRYGNVEDINRLDGKKLYEAWLTMLNTAYVKINIIGDSLTQEVQNEISKRFAKYNRTNITDITNTAAAKEASCVKTVTEHYDVAQGKLVMGFNCDCGFDSKTVNTLVMCDIFGGGPYSRLFTNVREKLSLCYYCSAYSVRNKGFIMVDSGVEAENAQKAQEEILNQLEIVKKGEFDDFEFEASKKGITDSLLASYDSLGSIDAWYTMSAADKDAYSPKELAEAVSLVTKQDVINAAGNVTLNTVYKLMPKEAK